jgi:ABC-type branched-subunit amino acid transport system ATPase component
MGTLLEIKGLNVEYGNGVHAVRHADLSLEEGSLTLLLGPNGAGKSSFLRAITGFMPGEGARVSAEIATLDGERFLGTWPHTRASDGLVLIPEREKVFGSMTTQENLRLVRTPSGERAARLAEVEALFPRLKDKATTRAGLLSGGERQMLAIARALLLRPRLLAIDELSMGLAPALTADLLKSVREINQRTGMTILLVEQAARAALRIADQVIVMRHGEITWRGGAGDLDDDEAFAAVYTPGAAVV